MGWNDYGARNYDALLGRWMGVDALAEKYMGYNPYVYCLGNPIRFTDIQGFYVIDPQATKEERAIIQEGINYARELVKDDKVMAALIRYGYTTADQILSDLVDNQGPVLKITFTGDKRYTLDDEYAPYGETVMYQHTNELGIGKSYINRIKKSRKTSRKDYAFLTAITILHESTHRNADKVGFSEVEMSEEGAKFEKESFGKVIIESNMKQYRIKFEEKQSKKEAEKEKLKNPNIPRA